MPIVYRPKRFNGLVVITDFALRSDAQLDEARPEEGVHCLEQLVPFIKALGRNVWRNTARIALFPHGTDLSVDPGLRGKERKAVQAHIAKLRADARDAAVAELLKLGATCTLVLATRPTTVKNKDVEAGEVKGAVGTMCWALFDAPDSLSAMEGTLHMSPLGPVVGVPHPGGQEFVHGENWRRWVVRAAKVAAGQSPLLVCPEKFFMCDTEANADRMADGLKRLMVQARAGAPISVDIESFTDGSVLTAVGFSDGKLSVCVPWEVFQPYGQNYVEEAAPQYILDLAADLLACPCVKITHNGVSSDVPTLNAHGFKVGGNMLDTYLMHGALRNQWKHGLQAVAASEFLVPPWKSRHKAMGAELGLTSDDHEFWVCDPKGLRDYCCDDAFYTWHIAQALMGQIL